MRLLTAVSGVRVPQQAPQHPKGCFFRVFDRTPAINDCVRPAHTTLRTPHSLTRHLLFRRVAPSPSRTGCGTAQNATVARRSVFERGSSFSLRGAPPPPTRQHRFNAASAWARVRRRSFQRGEKRVYAFCGGVNPVPRGGGVPRVPAGGGGGYNIKH